MKPNYRRCISCRTVAPKESFFRIVRVFPCRTVQLDEGMGRSAYVCQREDCLRAAQKKNKLGRSLKTAVPDLVYQALEQRLSSQSSDSESYSTS